MRWERLFDDLEAQLDAAEREEFEAEVADRTRRELALIHMADRLVAAVGRRVQLSVQGVGPVAGAVARVGYDWVLIEDDAGRDVIVQRAAVLTVQGLRPDAIGPAERFDSVLRLGHVLRGLARDRAAVVVRLIDAQQLEGTIDRVGADFIDLAVHPTDEPRRGGQAARVQTVGVGGLAVVRSS